jgi:hypothetical protein
MITSASLSQYSAPAATMPVHRAHHRLPARILLQRQRLAGVSTAKGIRGEVDSLAHVPVGGEGAVSRRPEHDGMDVILGVGVGPQRTELVEHRLVERGKRGYRLRST